MWKPELSYDVSTGNCQWQQNGVPIITYWNTEENKLWFEVDDRDISEETTKEYQVADAACKNFGVRNCDTVDCANQFMKRFGVYDTESSCFYEDPIMGIRG